jgi:hypothetical protein
VQEKDLFEIVRLADDLSLIDRHVSGHDDKKYYQLINDLIGMIRKFVLSKAIMDGLQVFSFNKHLFPSYYVRTSNISEELHCKILRLFEEGDTIWEITDALKDEGYKIPDDIMILW